MSRLPIGQDESCGVQSDARDTRSSSVLDVIETAKALMLTVVHEPEVRDE
jgi:hypothetical protein